MIKRLIGAALVGLLLLAGWFAWEQHQRAEAALARADSVATAHQEDLREVQYWARSEIAAWQDSTDKYTRQKEVALQRLRTTETAFNGQIESLLATADTSVVRPPQLLALRKVHVEAVGACRSALNACEANLKSAERRLTVYADSLIPSMRQSLEAERRLAEQAQNVADPGLVTRIGRNLELLGIGAAVGGIATCALVC